MLNRVKHEDFKSIREFKIGIFAGVPVHERAGEAGLNFPGVAEQHIDVFGRHGRSIVPDLDEIVGFSGFGA